MSEDMNLQTVSCYRAHVFYFAESGRGEHDRLKPEEPRRFTPDIRP